MLSRFELRRFRGLLPTLALIFAMIVPVIYGAVYLAANWDPYGKVKNLPVALVNDDTGASFNGQNITAGQHVQDELLGQKSFQWHITDAADASKGLASGRYYLVMHIPASFSRDLVSPAGDKPVRADITLQRNDANGFVIGSVTASAQTKIEQAVDQAAVEAYFKAVFQNLDKIRDGMKQARDGAQQLDDGLGTAKNGSAQLAAGETDAAAATTKLADGAGTLNAKLPELAGGATQLQSGIATLSSGSATLSVGATQVAGGTQQLYDTLAPALDLLAQNQSSAKAELDGLNRDIQALNGQVNAQNGSVQENLTTVGGDLDALAAADPNLANSKAFQDARSKLAAAQTTAGTIASASSTVASRSQALNKQLATVDLGGQAAAQKAKLAQLNDGAHQVADGAATLNQGLISAQDGAAQVATGVTAVQGGVEELSTGLDQLKDGQNKLKDGAVTLDGGIGRLQGGAQQLTDGLNNGLQQIPAVTGDEADQSALVLSQPVHVDAQVLNPASVYGRGLAPLFFSIAMWVFGISGFLVMRPISGRLLSGRLNPLRLTLSAWVPFGTIAVAGATLMLAVTWIGLGLNPVHELACVGLVVLVAVVFSLIAHTMRMGLGLPGSALLLVWLILQLSSTGGTYPAAVLPAFFRWINPLMPITYSIDAFRVVISGGLWSKFWIDVAVLAGIGVVALVLDCLIVRNRQRFRIRDLHPPLQH